MAGYEEMVSSGGSVPEGVFGRDHLKVVAQCLDQGLATVRIRHVEGHLQHSCAERQVEEVGPFWLFGDEFLVRFQQLHEPPLRCVYAFERRLVKYRPFAFSIDINLESLLHQLIAPALEN